MAADDALKAHNAQYEAWRRRRELAKSGQNTNKTDTALLVQSMSSASGGLLSLSVGTTQFTGQTPPASPESRTSSQSRSESDNTLSNRI